MSLDPNRAIVLYDSDCGVCNCLLAGLLHWDREQRLQPLALQTERAAELLHDLTPERRLSSWHLIMPTGERHSGGAALAPMLRELPHGELPASVVARVPKLVDHAYRWVADNRARISRFLPSGWKRSASVFVADHAHRTAAGR